MGVQKTIMVDGKAVDFKASAAVPRLYRLQFRRDIFADFTALSDATKDGNITIDSLELFENIAYIMAKHANPKGVPDDPDVWLEAFGMFSIYEILPQLLSLWGVNTEGLVTAKKNSDQP